MAVEIRILSGARQGESRMLSLNEFLVGDEPECDVHFDPARDRGAAGKRVLFRHEDDGWWVRNAGRGDTMVNQQILDRSMKLRSGDVVRLSATGPDFRFSIHADQIGSFPNEEDSHKGAPIAVAVEQPDDGPATTGPDEFSDQGPSQRQLSNGQLGRAATPADGGETSLPVVEDPRKSGALWQNPTVVLALGATAVCVLLIPVLAVAVWSVWPEKAQPIPPIVINVPGTAPPVETPGVSPPPKADPGPPKDAPTVADADSSGGLRQLTAPDTAAPVSSAANQATMSQGIPIVLLAARRPGSGPDRQLIPFATACAIESNGNQALLTTARLAVSMSTHPLDYVGVVLQGPNGKAAIVELAKDSIFFHKIYGDLWKITEAEQAENGEYFDVGLILCQTRLPSTLAVASRSQVEQIKPGMSIRCWGGYEPWPDEPLEAGVAGAVKCPAKWIRECGRPGEVRQLKYLTDERESRSLLELSLTPAYCGEGSPVLNAEGKVTAVSTTFLRKEGALAQARAALIDAETVAALWDNTKPESWVRIVPQPETPKK